MQLVEIVSSHQNMTKITITPLDTKDTEKAIEILFAAFEQDPLMRYFFGNEYQNLAKHLMQYICNLTAISDSLLWGAFIEGELKGVAMITPAEIVERNKQEIAQIEEQLAVAVGAAIARIERYLQVKEANKPKQPHFYLDVLGVSPESQGQGVGKALIEKLHQMSEESTQSCGVALDTENERNLDFYCGLGYSVSTTTDLDEVKIWSMFRPDPS